MMKPAVFSFMRLVIVLSLTLTEFSALHAEGLRSLKSPDGRFEAVLSDADRASSWQAALWLTIADHGHRVARFRFDGELVSGYWSPGGDYLAINNHNGYRGWYVWVIALRTGSVIKATGSTHSLDYSAYYDQELPNIYRALKGVLYRVNPGLNDYFRGGPITIAYGWKNARELLVFHEFISDTLAKREDAGIRLRSTFKISKAGVRVEDIKGEKVKLAEQYPAPIQAVLGWR